MTKVAERFINKNVGLVTIAEVTDEHILFSNGSEITFDHPQDCCEWNYADFEQIEDIARKTVFTLPLQFEEVDESGFRFGNPNKMFSFLAIQTKMVIILLKLTFTTITTKY
jgi:hypothetical protein